MRRKLLPLAIGTDCPVCGEVMLADEALDLDHSVPLAVNPDQIAGDRIIHAICNRRIKDGIRLGRVKPIRAPARSRTVLTPA
jgi:hypothetical protein